MDTEKIKQMGRDYFKANPGKLSRYTDDPVFLNAVKASSVSLTSMVVPWLEGYNEAAYAASKEGRAIELLGLLFMTDMNGDPDAGEVEAKVSAFLQEIGWKPNT